MLLQLQQASSDKIEKLMAYAKQNNMELSVIDDMEDDYFLPGKPLSDQALTNMITKGRTSGTILMDDVHNAIRKTYHAD